MRRLLIATVTAALLLSAPVASAAPGSHGGGGGGGGGGTGGSKTTTVSMVDGTASVDENAAPTFSLSMTRVGNLKCPVNVTYTLTPTSSSDVTKGSASFAANAASASLTLNIVNDGVPEDDEIYTVTLTGASVPQTVKGCKGITGVVDGNADHTEVTITDSDHTIVVPPGYSAHMRAISMGGCNNLRAFYEFNGVSSDIATKPVDTGCFNDRLTPDDITLTNDTSDPKPIRIGLQDIGCTHTYFSDTTSLNGAQPATVNHALVTGSASPWQVDISDAQQSCGAANQYRLPTAGNGELSLTIRLNPPPGSGSYSIPVGKQANVDVSLGGCDHLIAYYEGDDNVLHQIADNQSTLCDARTTGSVTVVNTSDTDPLSFRLVLEDVSCGSDQSVQVLYTSDGQGTADHAAAWATDPRSVDIADSGGGCGPDWLHTIHPDYADGNLQATVAFEDIPAP